MTYSDVAVVNGQDEVIGKMQRDQAIAEGRIYRVVFVNVFNLAGEVFLQKRSLTVDVYQNLWDCSIGGHVDAGESYEEAAAREGKEELGLTDLDLKPLGKIYAETTVGDTERKIFRKMYYAQTSQQPQIDQKEIAKGEWYSVEKVHDWIAQSPEEMTPNLINSLRLYEEKHG